MTILFGLIADNSSGKQFLHFHTEDDGEMAVTLTGNYEGKDIQIDFRSLDNHEVKDFIYLLNRGLNNET